MSRLRFWLVFLLLITPARPQEDPDALLVVGGHILSEDGSRWIEDGVIHIVGDRIEAIAPAAGLVIPPGTEVLDAQGLWLIPGLIDLHTHLVLYPYDQTSWNDQVLKESTELRTIRGVTAARATLEAGFTTIRELGTEGAGFADVALRDAIAQGSIPGPRVFAATRALVATGCYGPSGFAPQWSVPKGAQEADGVVGVRIAVRQQIAAGADWIKVYADYRRKPGDPSTPTYSLAELEAIVDEATSAGVPVAAHASTDEAIRRAVMAGVDTIEHGTGVSLETLRLMKDRGVALCPTLTAYESISRYSGWRPGQPDTPRLAQSRQMMKNAIAAGVTIACGSDAGVFAHGENARELELMQEWGLSHEQALRAATSVAADVLGREDLGRLRAGAIADIVALAADPLENVSATRQVRLVLTRGRVAVDRRSTPELPVESAILSVCRSLFEAWASRDFEGARRAFADGATVLAATEAGPRVRTIDEVIESARAQAESPDWRFEEWLTGRPEVRVDGDIATVWASYALHSEAGPARGVDAFQLARLDGAWKITSASFTQRLIR